MRRNTHTLPDRVFIYSMDSETQVDITMQVRKGLREKLLLRRDGSRLGGGRLGWYLGAAQQAGRGQYKKIF